MDEVRRKLRSAATAEEILHEAIKNAKPLIWITTRRVGGIAYRVPTPVREGEAAAIAMRTLLSAIRAECGRTVRRRLARAILAAYRGDVDPYDGWNIR